MALPPGFSVVEEPEKEMGRLPAGFSVVEPRRPGKGEGEGLDLQDVRGFGQTALSGLLSGWGDEAVGVARSALDAVLPETEADRIAATLGGEEQTFADKYAMYRDDARASAQEFSEENPMTALGAEVVGAIASPLNKVAPGMGAQGSIAGRLAGSVARGTAEGALYGLGAGEGSMEEQLASAGQGAGFGGGTAGVLTGGGGALGRLVSNSRIKEKLVDAAGNFKPVHMADPEGTIGQLYRSVVGGAFGGRGALGKQESRYLNSAKKLARFADDGKQLVEESVGTADELRRVSRSIDDAKRVAQGSSDKQVSALRGAAKAGKRQADDVARQSADDIAARSRVAVGEIEGQVPQINERVAREAVELSIPTTIPAEQAAKIRQMSPLDAEAEISKFFANDAFSSIKNIENVLVPKSLVKDINAAIKSNPELSEVITPAMRKGFKALAGKNISGAQFLEVRNTFARMANKVPSLKGKGARQFAGGFDNILKEQLGANSPAWKAYQDELAVWGNKQALSKAARQARKAGTDISAKNIGTKATDRGPLQASARSAREDIEGLRQAAKTTKDRASAETKQAALSKTAAKQRIGDATESKVGLEKVKAKRLDQVARASKNRLERASKGVLPETATAWSQAAATALLGAPVAIFGGLGALPAGAAVARGLASPSVQKAVVGQLPMQQMLAKALREGDMTKYQQILARIAAQQGTGE